MKVTLVPVQTGLADGAIEMLAGKSGFTVITMAFEVAGLPVSQIAVEVSTLVITLLFAGIKE